MDMSLVLAALGAQTGALQTQVATRILKMNADAEKLAAATLLGAGPQASSPVGAGIGGNLDISI